MHPPEKYGVRAAGFLEKPVERQNLSAIIEERLGRAIVSGELSAGEKLTEPELATRLGVSRAPIREALIGLEFAGLVQFDERGRSIVPAMEAEDIREIYLLRLALEPLAAQMAAERMTEETLARLNQNIQQTHDVQSQSELAVVDTKFHDLIFQASGMSRLRQFWQCIRYQIELWLNQMQPRFAAQLEETRLRTIESHSTLAEVLAGGDGEAAAEAMRKHLRGWLPLLSAPKKSMD